MAQEFSTHTCIYIGVHEASPAMGKRARFGIHLRGLSQNLIERIRIFSGSADDSQTIASVDQDLRQDRVNLQRALGLHSIALPGTTWNWKVLRLSRLVQWHYTSNGFFCQLMNAALAGKQYVCLSLMLYSDECTPGNVLAPITARKIDNFYVSCLQFGENLLSEHAWIHVASLLSSKIKEVDGGMSCIQRILLENWLEEEDSVIDGFTLLTPDGPVFVQFVFEPNVWDEKEMKEVWHVMGSGGKKPCMFCTNVLYKKQRHLPPGFVDITESDSSTFVAMQDDDLYDMYDSLRAAKASGMGPTVFGKLCTNAGLNFHENSVLGSLKLRGVFRPTSGRYDGFHVLWSNGVVQQEVDLMVEALAEEQIASNSDLSAYAAAIWRIGSNSTMLPRKIFKDDEVKGGAQQVKAAFYLLRHYISEFSPGWQPLSPSMQRKIDSFTALFDWVSELHSMSIRKDFSQGRCDNLKVMQKRWMDAFKAAHGRQRVRPKHHMAFHIPLQIEKDKFFVTTQAQEKKHKLISDVATRSIRVDAEGYELQVCLESNLIHREEANNVDRVVLHRNPKHVTLGNAI